MGNNIFRRILNTAFVFLISSVIILTDCATESIVKADEKSFNSFYDVNCDGEVNAEDINYLKRVILNDVKNSDCCDLNADGIVNFFDLAHLKKIIIADLAENGSVNSIGNDFNKSKDYVIAAFTSGYIKRDGIVVDTNDFSHATIKITKTNEPIYINGYTWYGNIQPYLYVQDDGVILHPDLPSNTHVTYVDYMEFIPEKPGTLYINNYHDNAAVIPYYKNIDDSDQFNKKTIENIETQGYLISKGVFAFDNNVSYTSQFIPCEEGDKFYYCGMYGANAVACVYYNNNGDVVGYESKNSISIEEKEFTVPQEAKFVQFSGYHAVYTAYKQSSLTKNSVQPNSIILGEKTWCAFGDSFTSGDFTGYIDAEGHTGIDSDAYDVNRGMYKTWAYWIAERNNMDLINLAKNGAKTQFIATDNLYQTVPEDCDYVTFMFGLNDSKFDGEIDSTDSETWYGAWHVALSWLRENRPNTKVGIIIPSSWLGNSVRGIIEEVAKYHGVPVLNLYSDSKVPALLGTPDGEKLAKDGMDKNMSIIVTQNNIVSETNWHPNLRCFEEMSFAIEKFMEAL